MRAEKESIIQEIRESVTGAEFVFLADYRGLTVEQMADLRALLRPLQTSVHVVKNSFLNCAVKDLGWDGAAADLDGPTVMIRGSGDATVAAKVLSKFIASNSLPVVKGGMFGTERLMAADVESMARIPSRGVMLGIFVGTVAAPMTRLVGVMNQKISSLLYVLKAVEDKKNR